MQIYVGSVHRIISSYRPSNVLPAGPSMLTYIFSIMCLIYTKEHNTDNLLLHCVKDYLGSVYAVRLGKNLPFVKLSSSFRVNVDGSTRQNGKWRAPGHVGEFFRNCQTTIDSFQKNKFYRRLHTLASLTGATKCSVSARKVWEQSSTMSKRVCSRRFHRDGLLATEISLV
ncbi:hypothetical protein PM082_021669 [Marasmius tenuissimus]|nr:hypothetical protein PM082_021669 [Marasmius tenuissimus]